MDRNFTVLKIDHVAIAVKSNESETALFKLLGMNVDLSESVDAEKVNVVKVKTQNRSHTIELLEASDESSVVKKFIDRKGQGLHRIALEVDNIEEAIKYLKHYSIQFVYNSPKIGANNKLITFIHPKSTPGILLELCQSS